MEMLPLFTIEMLFCFMFLVARKQTFDLSLQLKVSQQMQSVKRLLIYKIQSINVLHVASMYNSKKSLHPNPFCSKFGERE